MPGIMYGTSAVWFSAFDGVDISWSNVEKVQNPPQNQ